MSDTNQGLGQAVAAYVHVVLSAERSGLLRMAEGISNAPIDDIFRSEDEAATANILLRMAESLEACKAMGARLSNADRRWPNE